MLINCIYHYEYIHLVLNCYFLYLHWPHFQCQYHKLPDERHAINDQSNYLWILWCSFLKTWYRISLLRFNRIHVYMLICDLNFCYCWENKCCHSELHHPGSRGSRYTILLSTVNSINSLRPWWQNGQHFADNIFQSHFFVWKLLCVIKIYRKFITLRFQLTTS